MIYRPERGEGIRLPSGEMRSEIVSTGFTRGYTPALLRSEYKGYTPALLRSEYKGKIA